MNRAYARRRNAILLPGGFTLSNNLFLWKSVWIKVEELRPLGSNMAGHAIEKALIPLVRSKRWETSSRKDQPPSTAIVKYDLHIPGARWQRSDKQCATYRSYVQGEVFVCSLHGQKIAKSAWDDFVVGRSSDWNHNSRSSDESCASAKRVRTGHGWLAQSENASLFNYKNKETSLRKFFPGSMIFVVLMCSFTKWDLLCMTLLKPENNNACLWGLQGCRWLQWWLRKVTCRRLPTHKQQNVRRMMHIT